MTNTTDHQAFTPRFDCDVPQIVDYFGTWNINEDVFRELVEHVQGKNLSLHMRSDAVRQSVQARDSRLYQVDEHGIATFVIDGVMMKSVPSMADGTSYARIRQQVQSARRDPEVKGGLLLIDTPGGTARGNEDAVKAFAKFAAEKPLYSFTEDMTCSAGVSIASQAHKRFANNATAFYGSMGTYAVLQDTSSIAEKLGVKIHVIKAGEHKGGGVAGTEITDEQLAETQRIVNAMNENYLGLIASGLGRSIESIRPLADGRVIMAADAVTHGLIDAVQTIEETLSQLREAVSRKTTFSVPNSRSSPIMATERTPATLKELKQTFPNSTADWREVQMENEADLSQAAIDYANFVEAKANTERESLQAQIEEAKNAAAKPTAPSLGHHPLTMNSVGDDTGIESGDAVSDFHTAVNARLPKHRTVSYTERQAAIAFVARAQPALHRAYIGANNTSSRAKRLLQEKYEANDEK